MLMKKILVTTDFSSSSRAALRFAIQLARQGTFEIIFYHAYSLLIPGVWPQATLDAMEKKEAAKIRRRLYSFAKNIFNEMGTKPEKIRYVIKNNALIVKGIITYANQHQIDYICLSTSGSGKLKKIFGGIINSLIQKSAIPVIAVPPGYQPKEITQILYSSDLENLETELNKCICVAKNIHAQLGLLHLQGAVGQPIDGGLLQQTLHKLSNFPLKLYLENQNFEKPLVYSLKKAIENINPGIVLMFAQQNKSFFEKLITTGRTASYLPSSTFPLLIFKKQFS